MFCRNCGAKNAENTNFCGSCGAAIAANPSAATTMPQPAPSYKPMRAAPAKPPVNRLLFVIPVAVVVVVLVGFLLNGGSNPYGLEGVWVASDNTFTGREWSTEVEFRGNTITMEGFFNDRVLDTDVTTTTSRRGTFSISDDDRMEILWDYIEEIPNVGFLSDVRRENVHEVRSFSIIENELAPNQLQLNRTRYTFERP